MTTVSGRLLLDGPAIARELKMHPGTLRNWAAARWIGRYGQDERGRTLYDVDEVLAVRDLPPADRRQRHAETT